VIKELIRTLLKALVAMQIGVLFTRRALSILTSSTTKAFAMAWLTNPCQKIGAFNTGSQTLILMQPREHACLVTVEA